MLSIIPNYTMQYIDKTKFLLLLLNSLGLIFTILVNYLANTIPIGGMSTGEISALYPNLFVPAGFTFAIWGVIYLSLFIMIGGQWKILLTNTAKSVNLLKGPWFFFSCLANMGWIVAWHFQQTTISLLVMGFLLLSLLNLYTDVRSEKPQHKLNVIPISLYTSWISIATVANTTAWLVDISWNGLGISEILWANMIIIVATGISMAMIYKFKDLAWSAVVLWALWGIRTARAQEGVFENESIIISAYVSMSLIVLLSIIIISRKQIA